MAEALAGVMFVAAVLYTVLAGADFGAGLVEGFVRREHRERVDVALAPVWEANHVWLVLIAVLAFVGFPELYTLLTSYLHIPLLLVLLGIVARGAAFTFRHYDPAPGLLHSGYTAAFRAGSFLAPLFLGVIVAASASGRLPHAPPASFYDGFVAPWNTASCWLTGLFVCALFAFEGAALLAAENARGEGAPLPYLRLARGTHALAIGLGALVLASAWHEQAPWLRPMLTQPLPLAGIVLATALIPAVALAFRRGRPWPLRLAMGAQASAVLFSFFAAQYPVLMRVQGRALSLQALAAPAAALHQLALAVGVGLVLILPAMAYLVRVYKR